MNRNSRIDRSPGSRNPETAASRDPRSARVGSLARSFATRPWRTYKFEDPDNGSRTTDPGLTRRPVALRRRPF